MCGMFVKVLRNLIYLGQMIRFKRLMGKVGLDHVMDGFNIWLRNKVKQREIKFRDVFLCWRVELDKLKLENGD